MTFVLNILARHPDGDTEDHGRDGNIAVRKTRQMMEAVHEGRWGGHSGEENPRGVSYQTRLVRASFVHDIVIALLEYRGKPQEEQPDFIQIIGHGMSGRLQLGSYWTNQSIDPVLGHTVLDSDPASYGMLRGLIPDKSKVFLLGCNVGSSSSSGYVASGRALLFDLEDMSAANFYAANDLVSPASFEDGFLYTGSLVTSSGKLANPAALVRQPQVETTPVEIKGDLLIVRHILAAPALGFDSELEAEEALIQEVFGGYIPAVSKPEGILAMAEFRLETSKGPAEVIADMRYIRAHKDGVTHYFELPLQESANKAARRRAVADLRNKYLAQRTTALLR